MKYSVSCVSVIVTDTLVVDTKIRKNGAIELYFGPIVTNLNPIRKLAFDLPILLFIVHRIPIFKKPYERIFADRIPLTIQSKLIFIENGTSNCLITCQACSKNRIEQYGIRTAEILAIAGKMELQRIKSWKKGIHSTAKKWMKLNNNFFSAERYKSTSYCDSSIGDFDEKRHRYDRKSAKECAINFYYERLNCSSQSCIEYLRKFLFVPVTMINYTVKSFSRPGIVPLPFGVAQMTYKFMIFYPPHSHKEATLNILALTRPITTTGWTIIVFICTCFAFALWMNGVNAPVLKTIAIFLEQEWRFGNMSAKVALMLTTWSFGCLLLRFVYTSSMFTYLTVKSPPVFPTSFEYILFNTPMDVISTEDGLVKLSLRKSSKLLRRILKPIDYWIPKSKNSSDKIVRCYPIGSSNILANSEDHLIKNLSMFSEISCEIYVEASWLNKTSLQVKTKSKFKTFMLSYDTDNHVAFRFAIFSSRNVVENSERAYTNMMVYSTLFRHSLEDSLVGYLGNIDASGLLVRLLRYHREFRGYIELRKINEKMKFRKTWNFFSLLSIQRKFSARYIEVENHMTAFRLPDAVPVFIVWTVGIAGALIMFFMERLRQFSTAFWDTVTMGTPLQWLSFSLPFRIYDHIFPFPFKWYPNEKKLIPAADPTSDSLRRTVWLWLGSCFMIATLLMISCHLKRLYDIDNKEQQGLGYYIQLLATLIHFILAGVVLQATVYYTKNASDMAALFTDSYKALVITITELNGWNHFPYRPFYKDFVGFFFCATVPVPLICAVGIPVIGIVSGFDPLGAFMPKQTSLGKLNQKIDRDLDGSKLGGRYAKTLRMAKISAPFFGFVGTNFPNILAIPLDITMNLVLTFPLNL
ncbi:unnamed protein product [Orchesella dallaii]|uniref:Anoctamin n=1 Tax=Orchesella dallaii TaxID=48710 RepID=A0ABP1Q375_9HEXA